MSEVVLWIVGRAYRIVGRSAPNCLSGYPSDAWFRRARHIDGTLVPPGGNERQIDPDRKKEWDAGCYDILVPLDEPATGFTLTASEGPAGGPGGPPFAVVHDAWCEGAVRSCYCAARAARGFVPPSLAPAESGGVFITAPPENNQGGEISPSVEDEMISRHQDGDSNGVEVVRLPAPEAQQGPKWPKLATAEQRTAALDRLAELTHGATESPTGHVFCSHPTPEGNAACDRERTGAGPASSRLRDRGLTAFANEVLAIEVALQGMEKRWRGAEHSANAAAAALRFYQRKTKEAGENLTLILHRTSQALDEAIASATTSPEEAIAILRLIKDALADVPSEGG